MSEIMPGPTDLNFIEARDRLKQTKFSAVELRRHIAKVEKAWH